MRYKSAKTLTASNGVQDLAGSNPSSNSQFKLSADTQFAVKGIVSDLSTTRPAPLNMPDPPHPYAWPSSRSLNPSRWDFKYLFTLGKTYAKFYYTGIKHAWGNRKTAQQIRSRLKGTNPDHAARYISAPERLSYNEYELLLRSRRDLLKFVPFGLVFAVFGEFTPLVIVLLGSRVVPGTCIIPKQEDQDRQKMLQRDQTYMQEMVKWWRQYNGDQKSNESIDRKQEDSRRPLPHFDILSAYRLGLTSFTKLPPVMGSLIDYRITKMLRRNSEQVLSAAVLVEREGGWKNKSPQDMWEWGNKYGLYKLRQYTRQAQARGEHPISEKMKQALLPTFTAETQAMLSMASSQEKQDFAGFQSPLIDAKPDCKALRRDIELMVDEKS